MNDFDSYLETELKLMLDPVVARRPPRRRGQLKESCRLLVLPSLPAEGLAAEVIHVVPTVATVPVAHGSSL